MKLFYMLLPVLVAGVFVTGCGKSGSGEVNARSSAPKQVSKWKHQPKSAKAGPMGLVIETQGNDVTAISIHSLKEGPGFVVDSGLSANKFLLKGGVYLVPIGLPPVGTVEDWLKLNGACWEITYKPAATNVIARIKSVGVPDSPVEFLPFRE